jgi:hypothetical protein
MCYSLHFKLLVAVAFLAFPYARNKMNVSRKAKMSIRAATIVCNFL